MDNNDQFLRDILANGIEQPSSSFTSKVMKTLSREKVRQQERIEVPSAIVFMAVLFPLIALLASIDSVYAKVDFALSQLGLASVISQQSIVYISLGILFFSLIDIALLKWCAKHEHRNDSNKDTSLSF